MVEGDTQKVERMKQIIFKAIKQHSVKPIEELFDKGFPVDLAIMPNEVNALLYCSAVGDAKCLEAILAAKPKADYVDTSGKNCLHYACKAGNTANFKVLFDAYGGDEEINLLDAQSEAGVTPLMLAVQSVQPELVVECLNNQANPFLIGLLAIGEILITAILTKAIQQII